MRKVIESVPNFSEGRRKDVVDALASALAGAPGVALLDSEMDAAHNRCVISVAGEPDAVAAGVVAAVGKAVELIDLRVHRGEHPRMGAADVIPFVPITGTTIEECVQLSEQVGREIAERYGIPVYLYEESARVAARKDLAYVRKGGFEVIREEIAGLSERRPDFGPLQVHPSAGATAVGARFPLIAYNVYLDTPNLAIAQAIARAIRFSSGGLRYVKALGFEIKERNQVQVSMNLTNFERSPVYRAFEMIRREAERYGVAVSSSEIVGLVPQKAVDACAEFYLSLEGFSEDQVLENRLAEKLAVDAGLSGYISSVAAPEAIPGGGNVAAVAGSLAAALGEMVAGLTRGRKKFEAVEARMAGLYRKLALARSALYKLAREDSDAYLEVMKALKLSKETPEQKATRSEALEIAIKGATETPLQTARAAAEVLQCLRDLVDFGNPNARSDAAAGAQIAFAALKGAQYNVLTNIPGLKDADFARSCRIEVNSLASDGEENIRRIDKLLTGR